jgi:hypothetical protein
MARDYDRDNACQAWPGWNLALPEQVVGAKRDRQGGVSGEPETGALQKSSKERFSGFF